MVGDMHSFAALRCRTHGNGAGRSTGLQNQMKIRLQNRRLNRSHLLFAPNLQQRLRQSQSMSSPRHRRPHRLQQLPLSLLSSRTQSLCLNMWACSILR